MIRLLLTTCALAALSVGIEAQSPSAPKPRPTLGRMPPNTEARFDIAGEPISPAESNAIVLFDGKYASSWTHRETGQDCAWKISDGVLQVTPGLTDIVTKQDFGDYELHVEFNVPLMPDAKSQGRGNSGCYQHGRYEIQILDNVDNPTYKFGGCAAIYGQKDPDFNVPMRPGEWQTYDIVFRAPRFSTDGKTVTEKPRITVLWNGVKVHDNVEITLKNTTAGLEGDVPARGPILLQNHGNPVKFRNIWIVEKPGK